MDFFEGYPYFFGGAFHLACYRVRSTSWTYRCRVTTTFFGFVSRTQSKPHFFTSEREGACLVAVTKPFYLRRIRPLGALKPKRELCFFSLLRTQCSFATSFSSRSSAKLNKIVQKAWCLPVEVHFDLCGFAFGIFKFSSI